MTRRRSCCLGMACGALLLGFGCGEDVPRATSSGFGQPTEAVQAGSSAAQPEAAASTGPERRLRFREEDFVESDANRDPFRSYVDVFRMKAPEVSQRRVLMADVSIDEMRLIAIVTGIAQPKAMLVDPRGIGHVVERGVFVGKPQVVQSGDEGVPVTLNWRVERIRANEVVLTREDPTDPGRPSLSRVIPLHEDSLTASL